MKNGIFKSCDGDVHEQDWVAVSPQFAAVNGAQRNELSNIVGRCVLHLAVEFNNAVYTHEEKKPPDKLAAMDQVVIFSGKEPDVLLKLDIKYENPITYICKLKEPTNKDKELQVITNSKSEAEGGKCSCNICAKSPNQKGNRKFREKFVYKGSSSVKLVEENLCDVEKKISSCNACRKSLKQKKSFKFH